MLRSEASKKGSICLKREADTTELLVIQFMFCLNFATFFYNFTFPLNLFEENTIFRNHFASFRLLIVKRHFTLSQKITLAPGSHCEPQANNIVELLLFTASKMVPHSKVIIFQSRLPSQLLRARSRLGYTRGKNLIRRHCSKAGQTTNQSHSQHDINIINLKNS